VGLQTARLRLRRWRDDDLATLARWNADPVVMRHMGRALQQVPFEELGITLWVHALDAK
jgi:RimJ/RimL family protein N-acetyltransferase